MNGEVRQVTVDDQHAAVENKSRPKADSSDSSQVGAPMSGVVVEVRAKDGSEVQKGDPIAVLSAMKMVSSLLYFKRQSSMHHANNPLNRKWSSPLLTPARSARLVSRRVTLLTART
jgi:pyruvate carboxylase